MITPTMEEMAARLFELERRIDDRYRRLLTKLTHIEGNGWENGTPPGGIEIEIKHDQSPGEKPVELTELSPQMVLATMIVASHFAQYTGILTITSGFDGLHAAKSKHNRGDALDYRTRHIEPGLMRELAAQVETALAHQFDVILKEDADNRHLHIEYDPWRSGQHPQSASIRV